MRKIYLSVWSLCLFSFISAQGIEFFEGSWEEAKSLAAEEEKLIFVDAYAQWCGPCKRMAKQVFTNPSVGEYYNENFINLKIDMERGMGLSFRELYPVSAFPTLFYIDAKGEIINKVVGGQGVKAFVDLGKKVIAMYDRSGDYAELYEKGDRDFDLVLKYVKALNRADKSSLKVSNEFLRNSTELSDAERAEFLFEALTHADSRIFTLFIDERALIETIKGKDAVEDKIEAACWNTIHNAIDFEMAELASEAKKKMEQNCTNKAFVFTREADYEYAKALDDTELLRSSALKMAQDVFSDDPEELYLLAEDLFLYKNVDREMIDASEKIISMAVKQADNIDYFITHSKILVAQENKKKALKSLNRALRLASNDEKRYREVRELIESIEGS